MELPKEIIYKILSMMYKDSDQQSLIDECEKDVEK